MQSYPQSHLYFFKGFTYVTMKGCLYQVNKGIRTYVLLCLSAVIFRFFLPIIYNDRTLPLTCWYPVDYKVQQNLHQFTLTKKIDCISKYIYGNFTFRHRLFMKSLTLSKPWRNYN